MSGPIHYGTVFVLAAEMEPDGSEFLEEGRDGSGYLGGMMRAQAAAALLDLGWTERIAVVGGPTTDGVSKVKRMAEIITQLVNDPNMPPVLQLESPPNSLGNLAIIKQHAKPGDGILSHSYHLARVCWSAIGELEECWPIFAEMVLLAHDPRRWAAPILAQQLLPSWAVRIAGEAKGVKDLVRGEYAPRRVEPVGG